MRNLPSNREWIFWGQHDPLFAVATRRGKQAGGPAPWTPEEFFENGRRYFADVVRQWQQYGAGADHCVEVGCGAGRITRQLARHFCRVSALDVSPAQLEIARRLLGSEGDNIEFSLVDGPRFPLENASCDAVFSCEVFQHLDPASALGSTLVEAHRVLQPGGTVCFQVPLRGIQPASLLASGPRNALLRLLRRLGRRRLMIYRQYRAAYVFRALADSGFGDIELRVFRAAEQPGFHCYFFGRKMQADFGATAEIG